MPNQATLPVSTSVNLEKAMIASGEMVLMQTATTRIQNPTSSLADTVRILLDSGSHRSYITEKLAKKLKLKFGKVEEIYLVTFGTEKTKVIKAPVTTLNITLKDNTEMTISANVVPKITGTIQRMPIDPEICQHWETLWKDIPLADSLPNDVETSTIELLIGNDYYLDMILPQKIQVHPGLYLLGSRLGWILTGRTNGISEQHTEPNMLILTMGTQVWSESSTFTNPDSSLPIKPNLDDFWNLETIGIKDSYQESDDDKALQHFNQTIKFKYGRYHVKWPWKEEEPDIPENRELAYGRLKSLVKKLAKNPELLEKYNSIIMDQTNKRVIEPVTSESEDGPIKHYIPHHAVINAAKATTKVRIVYDASAKVGKESKNLNECLYRGPVMLQNLCGLLMRFRLPKIAIIADIEKAFLQVGLQNPDRDVTRFFWLKDHKDPHVEGNIQIYRFCRVPFGVISSPFLLAATVDHHLKKYESPTAEKVRENIYVDNLITGTGSSEQAYNFYTEAKQIFQDASMNLRDWSSNSQELLSHIPEYDQSKSKKIKVLGTGWNVQEEVLTVSGPDKDKISSVATKREALQAVSSVFDPLGFLIPVTLKAKLFLQELWKDNLKWDDKLPEPRQSQWYSIAEDLMIVKTCQIPRFIGTEKNDGQMKYELFCFCDASNRAYATVVYLGIQTEEKCQVNMVFSKNRLCPQKRLTVPKSELLAVLIGVRSLNFVQKELKLPLSNRMLWSDSQCVLKWIRSKRQQEVFVENRLKEIRAEKDIQFRYISTSENPADVATRGTSVQELQKMSSWWHGPEWLVTSKQSWPTWNFEVELHETDLVAGEDPNWKNDTDEDPQGENATDEKVNSPMNIDDKRFSSLLKLLRVTAWALRFIKLLKKQRQLGPLTAQELREAKLLWEREVQRRSFPAVIKAARCNQKSNLKEQLGLQIHEDGLLHCHGRLANAEITEGARFPKLLPKKDHFTDLVIKDYHKKRLHS
ncbi:uncharacterized protein [Ptychodera flava]|uniref:uncharacterized protein n=1 Tax=Ptychodera flava TaxID=63121 RepID=UPI00396A2DD0